MRELVILAVAALLVAGCGKPADESRGPAEKVFRMAITEEPATLDPAPIATAYSAGVARRLFSTLVRFDSKMKLQPDLAESWTISPDGLTYTFKLRKGVRFHNGREVNARDMIYSLERVARMRAWIVRPIAGCWTFAKGEAKRIVGLSAPDDRTLAIRLERPFSPFLAHLSMVNTAVVPKEAVEKLGKAFARRPVGSGPFRLASWRRKSRLRLERFDDYFRGPAKLDAVEVRIIGEPLVSFQAYKSGELDICAVPREKITAVQSGPLSAQLHTTPNLITHYVGVTMTREPLGTMLALRKALNYAINRKYLCERVLRGAAVPAKGVLPPGIPGYSADLAGFTYDPDKAKALIREAGYGPKRPVPPLRLIYKATANNTHVVEQVQSDLERVGVTVKLRSVDFAALLQATLKGSADLFKIAWVADYPDPDNFLYVLFYSKQRPSEGNRTHFADKKADKSLEACRAETDPAKRLTLYQQAEKIVLEQSPWIVLYHTRSFFLINPNVRNLTPGVMDDDSSLLGVDFHKVDFADPGRPVQR